MQPDRGTESFRPRPFEHGKHGCRHLIDRSGGFATGFLVLAAVPLVVIGLTTLIRPFDLTIEDRSVDAMEPALPDALR